MIELGYVMLGYPVVSNLLCNNAGYTKKKQDQRIK